MLWFFTQESLNMAPKQRSKRAHNEGIAYIPHWKPSCCLEIGNLLGIKVSRQPKTLGTPVPISNILSANIFILHTNNQSHWYVQAPPSLQDNNDDCISLEGTTKFPCFQRFPRVGRLLRAQKWNWGAHHAIYWLHNLFSKYWSRTPWQGQHMKPILNP